MPGGLFNTALGDFSFAAGGHAKANHTGAFVWSDTSRGDYTSTADNQFAVRATGGVQFVTAVDPDSGAPTVAVEISPGTGTVTAPAFVGDGSGLTNLPPSSAPANTVTYHVNLLRVAIIDKIDQTTINRFGLRLPQGVVIHTIRVCGRDNDADTGNLGVSLRRKALRGGDIFAESVIVASGESGASFAEDLNQCFDFATNLLVDNTQYSYFIEYIITGPAQISVAQLDYR